MFSQTIAGFAYEDCPAHASWIEPTEWLGGALAQRFPLHLISDQPASRLHSQLDFSAHSLAAKVADREPVWVHPVDARLRGIADGDVVRLFNTRGACLAGAVITEAIRPGVVKLSTGAWFDPQDDAPQTLCKHGNANMLTRDAGTSRLAQGPVAQSCLVQMERYTGPLPKLSAFDLPRFVGRTDA